MLVVEKHWGDEGTGLVDLAGPAAKAATSSAPLEEEAGDPRDDRARRAQLWTRSAGSCTGGDEDFGARLAERADAGGVRLGRSDDKQRRLVEALASSCASRGSRACRVEDDPDGLTGIRDARAVSSGSSAKTVPMPTAIASASARQRCTRARLCSAEIQGDSPGAVAVPPSRDIASFRVTRGNPVRACLRKDWLSRRAAAASAPAARATSTPPSRRMPGPRPEAFSVGVLGGDHDPLDPRLENRLDTGRLAPLMRTGLQRHVHRRPRRILPRAPGSPPRAARSACNPPSSAWYPSPITAPSLMRTAPTSGFGDPLAPVRAQPTLGPAVNGPDPCL